MAHVTLVLSRNPLIEFHHGGQSGRWGTMSVIEGPKVLAVSTPETARLVNGPPPAPEPQPTRARVVPRFAEALASVGSYMARSVADIVGPELASISLNGERLQLLTEGGPIKKITEFDTMARFRADTGKGFYMQVRPRPSKPYPLSLTTSTEVAKVNGTGRCLKVYGHGYKQQASGDDAGILVHEAPHVGWLIGCISPREKNHREQNEDKMPSRQAMEKIFSAMGNAKSAALLVLNW